MSTHYIFVRCERCGVSESIYTGNADLDLFHDDWEQSTIKVVCIKCKEEN